MRDKDLLKQLLQDGWTLDRIKGSHHTLKKGDKTLTVPIHGKELGKGLENAIRKQAGLK